MTISEQTNLIHCANVLGAYSIREAQRRNGVSWSTVKWQQRFEEPDTWAIAQALMHDANARDAWATRDELLSAAGFLKQSPAPPNPNRKDQ